MDNFPFDVTGLNEEAIKRFYDAYKTIKTRFNIQLTGHIDFNLKQFEVFKNYLDIEVKGSYVIKQDCGDTYILFLECHYKTKRYDGGFNDNYEYQTCALAYLKNNFGRILIRRETLSDKIQEIIHPLELDFKEDKAFSDTFYVIVNDHAKAVAGMNRNFRNAVMDVRHDDFVIELVDHTLLVAHHNPISAEQAGHMAEFVARIAAVC